MVMVIVMAKVAVILKQFYGSGDGAGDSGDGFCYSVAAIADVCAATIPAVATATVIIFVAAVIIMLLLLLLFAVAFVANVVVAVVAVVVFCSYDKEDSNCVLRSR